VLFGLTTGVAALAGGDITIEAGRDPDDVPVLATSAIRTVSITKGDGTTAKGVQFHGDSDVTMAAGRDILGGADYVTSLSITLDAVRDIRASGGRLIGVDRSTRLRLLNADASATAGRNASLIWAGRAAVLRQLRPMGHAGGNLAFDLWRPAISPTSTAWWCPATSRSRR